MLDIDETDRRILELLLEDARRPYSDIADRVDLSAPAVSNRVERLREAGVIERFTLELDRSLLRDGTPVLVRVSISPGAEESVTDALAGHGAVEHVFRTAEATVVATAHLPEGRTDVTRLLAEADVESAVRDLDVTLVAGADWSPALRDPSLVRTCVECDNAVTGEGVVATVDGDRHYFCCPTCEARFRERYEKLSEGA
jgi:DNA-binding Lrp family transcriptional regulator